MKITPFIKHYPLVSIAYGLSALFLFIAFVTLLDAQESLNWQYTDGEVTHKITTRLGGNYGTSSYKSADLSVYVQQVLYRYKVGSTEYEGQGVIEGVKNLSKGSKINVYYNPQTPDKSRLLIGTNWYKLLMWLGFACITGGTGWTWLRFQQKHLQ